MSDVTEFKTAEEGKIVISLTGHRPNKLAGYKLTNNFYTRLRKRLIRMALGADTVWAQAIIDCRHRFGKDRVRFVADIPDYNQSSRWTDDSKRLWKALLGYADEVRTYNENDGKSYAYVLNQRNIGMIDACDLLIAVYNGDKTGGTANGFNYGKSTGKYITIIAPHTV